MWSKNNTEKRKEYLNRPETKAKYVLYQARSLIVNREQNRLRKAVYSAANSAKIVAKVAAWRKLNPAAHRISDHNRRATVNKYGGVLTRGLADKLFKLQRGKCVCCGMSLKDGYHMDHIVPLALGGLNVDSNIQLLRPRCNNQKSMKHPIKFMQERGLLL